jgi:poly(hydroxyalkanoate) granule-associated protein
MARKTRRQEAPDEGADTQQAIRDSAQKIWLAGLGAFERARSEGPRMFETLVEQGRNMGAKAVGAADDALKTLRQANYGGGQWDKLEQVFEDRVSRSLQRLGVLTSREVEALSRQVQDLNETVRTLMASGGKAAAPKPKAGSARKARKKAAPAAKARATKAKRASRAPRA